MIQKVGIMMAQDRRLRDGIEEPKGILTHRLMKSQPHFQVSLVSIMGYELTKPFYQQSCGHIGWRGYGSDVGKKKYNQLIQIYIIYLNTPLTSL